MLLIVFQALELISYSFWVMIWNSVILQWRSDNDHVKRARKY